MTRTTNSNGTLLAYSVNGGEVQPGDRYGYKIVAVVYSKNFWAAYKGLTDWDDERVADEGDKILHEVAALLFPTINETIPNYND
jgi:hypothetical protein